MSVPHPKENLRWEDVEGYAQSLFDVWLAGREIEWAQLGWTALERAGLTTYGSELERHEVLCRLAVLASLYREFCQLVWEEYAEPEYESWIHDLEMSTFRLAQLAGDALAGPRYDGYDDEALAGEALRVAVESMRPEVVKALKDYFNGNDSLLFASLYATNWEPPFDDDDFDDDDSEDDDEDEEEWTLSRILASDEALDDILNTVDDGKLAGFAWVTEGMYSIGW